MLSVSAHRLLDQLDRSGEAVQEKRHQDRMLRSIRTAGSSGVGLRDLYRNLNFSAKQARQIAGHRQNPGDPGAGQRHIDRVWQGWHAYQAARDPPPANEGPTIREVQRTL